MYKCRNPFLSINVTVTMCQCQGPSQGNGKLAMLYDYIILCALNVNMFFIRVVTRYK